MLPLFVHFWSLFSTRPYIESKRERV